MESEASPRRGSDLKKLEPVKQSPPKKSFTLDLAAVVGERKQQEVNGIQRAFRVSGATGLFSNKINGIYACSQDHNGLKKLYHTEKTFSLLKKDGTLDQTTITFCNMDDGLGRWIIERQGLFGHGSCYLLAYCKQPNLPHPANATRWFVINASEEFRLQPSLKVELSLDPKAERRASRVFRSRMQAKGVLPGDSYF